MRKLFGTDGVRGMANKYPMTAEIALKLAKAAACVMTNGRKAKVVIGKDTRLSGYIFENALTAGFCSMGVDVYLVGPMPTPAIAHLIRSFGADAGIMVSASHNPATDNGLKLFGADGFKLPDETEEKIEQLALGEEIGAEHVSADRIGKAYRINDARGRYVEFVKNSVSNISLKGFKIVLDCANGAAYSVAPLIFSELGAEVIVLNSTPNGININEGCGALHPEVVSRAVLKEQADIGIAVDGDADRVILVDEKGTVRDGDEILAVCGLQMAAEGRLKGNQVIATEYSNTGLDETLGRQAISLSRAENGDRYVIEQMRKANCNLGGERSGHIIFLDYSTTGDGTLTGLQVLAVMKKTGKKLSELASVMTKHPQVQITIAVKEKRPLKEFPHIIKLVAHAENELKRMNGRLHIRYSGTQSVLRIMAEGPDDATLEKLVSPITESVQKELGV